MGVREGEFGKRRKEGYFLLRRTTTTKQKNPKDGAGGNMSEAKGR